MSLIHDLHKLLDQADETVALALRLAAMAQQAGLLGGVDRDSVIAHAQAVQAKARARLAEAERRLAQPGIPPPPEGLRLANGPTGPTDVAAEVEETTDETAAPGT